ncbi:DUF5078 domain-containing protein, partial [Mycobacterium senegalense]|nr:DUF5078 domain-containing protein [Mycolicibacterium senegalense]
MLNRTSLKNLIRTGVAGCAVAGALAGAGIANADATDDYPIPNRILKT